MGFGYDGLARILSKVEDTGVWPDGLLDAYIAMIPKTDGDATPLGQSRGAASLLRVQLGGPRVRRARANVADVFLMLMIFSYILTFLLLLCLS